MQREEQVFNKVPAPVMEDQGQHHGKEKNISKLKKRSVFFPVLVDAVQYCFRSNVSFLRRSFEFLSQQSLRIVFHQETDIVNRDSRTRVEKQVQRENHQEQAQRENITMLSPGKVFRGQKAGLNDQSQQGAKDF